MLQSLISFELASQGWIGRDLLLDSERIRSGQLAIEISVQKQLRIFCLQPFVRWHHHAFSVPIASTNRWRARAKRDITVPTGTPIT